MSTHVEVLESTEVQRAAREHNGLERFRQRLLQIADAYPDHVIDYHLPLTGWYSEADRYGLSREGLLAFAGTVNQACRAEGAPEFLVACEHERTRVLAARTQTGHGRKGRKQGWTGGVGEQCKDCGAVFARRADST